MTSTIIAILSSYGFETRVNGLFWGIGSLVWGHTASVKALGTDLYEVTIGHWLYDDCGEQVFDTHCTQILHGAQALEWIFNEMPGAFWR